jgi:hypothetical protein
MILYQKPKGWTMDREWKFTLGQRELTTVKHLFEEKERRQEGRKYRCCVCFNNIPVIPGRTFDHQGWMSPFVSCGAYLLRQMEYQAWAEILYICQSCCQRTEDEEHLALEKRYNIPRP